MSSILYWGASYIVSGFLFNLLIINLYKEEFINFIIDMSKTGLELGEKTQEQFDTDVKTIETKFVTVSIFFSFLVSPFFLFLLIPVLFGKNPFWRKNT